MVEKIVVFCKRDGQIQRIQDVSFGKISGPQEAVLMLPTENLLCSPSEREENLFIDLYDLKLIMDVALSEDRMNRSSKE